MKYFRCDKPNVEALVDESAGRYAIAFLRHDVTGYNQYGEAQLMTARICLGHFTDHKIAAQVLDGVMRMFKDEWEKVE